jgi:hypothetical protein
MTTRSRFIAVVLMLVSIAYARGAENNMNLRRKRTNRVRRLKFALATTSIAFT